LLSVKACDSCTTLAERSALYASLGFILTCEIRAGQASSWAQSVVGQFAIFPCRGVSQPRRSASGGDVPHAMAIAQANALRRDSLFHAGASATDPIGT